MTRLLLTALAALLSILSTQAQTTAAPAPAPATTAPAADPSQPSAGAYNSIDPAKAAEIRKMLQVSGTAAQMQKMLDQAMASYKARNPSIPADFWPRLEKDANTGDLLDKMIPLYDKYYTLDDLKAMNTFYQSPAGQHVLAATPQILAESLQVGQQWGKAIAQKIAAEREKDAATPAPAAATPAPASTPAATPPGPGH